MKKFKPTNIPKEMDFYTIDLDNDGQKQIQLIGFTYKGDNWKVIDVDGVCVPLSEFVESMQESEDYINELYEASREYEEDVTDDQCIDAINHFFDGKPADYCLRFGEVTIDTPVGNYVNIGIPPLEVGDKVLWADKRTPIGSEYECNVVSVDGGLVTITHGESDDEGYFEVEVPLFEVIKIEKED